MNKHVFIAIASVVYATLFIATFHRLYDSMMILSFAMIGLCGWLYGIRIGVVSVFLYALLNSAILFFMAEQPQEIMLTWNPLALVLSVIFAMATGSLKNSYDQLQVLRTSLSSRFDEATRELEKLASELIENDEEERIQIGQALHDGVGQYLTSMLLHCEALNISLKEAGQAEAELATWMTRRVEKNIQMVRQLARSLLPMHFLESNLETALNEMTAYFSDCSSAHIRLTCHGNSSIIPSTLAQHLYRIVHEAVYCALFTHQAAEVDIKLDTGEKNFRTLVQGSGLHHHASLNSDFISEVMKYRFRAMGGQQAFTTLEQDGFRMECAVNFEGAGE